MSDAIRTSEADILTNPSAAQFLGGAVSLIPFSILAVSVKFWARRHQNLPLKVDDWFVIPALVGNLVLAGLAIWAHVSHSLGYQTPQPPPGTDPLDFMNEKIAIGKKLSWCIEMIQSITLTCTKLSLLYFYRRVFHTGYRGAFHYISAFLIGLSIVWGLTFFLCLMLVCHGRNPGLVWVDIATLNEYCGIWEYFSFSFAVSDVIIDFFIFVLPFVMVFRLRMSLTKKLATASMFLVGAFAIVAVTLRAYVLAKAAFVALTLYTKTKKGASNSPVTAQVLWGCIESTATLTAVCLPAVYAPTRDLVNRWRGKTADSGSHDSSSYAKSFREVSRRWTAFGGRTGLHDTVTADTMLDQAADDDAATTVVVAASAAGDNIPMITRITSTARKGASSHGTSVVESGHESGGDDSGSSKSRNQSQSHIRVEQTIHQTVQTI